MVMARRSMAAQRPARMVVVVMMVTAHHAVHARVDGRSM